MRIRTRHLPALTIPFVLLAVAYGQGKSTAENYTLTIDGESYDLALDETKTVTLPGGNKVQVELQLKKVLEFRSAIVSFKHKNVYSPVHSAINDSVSQTLLSSPTGGTVIVQEYVGLDPSSLVDVMVEKLTEEEVASGWDRRVKSTSRKVDGQTLEGKEVVTTLGAEKWTRIVVSANGGEKGLLIITAIDHDSDYAREKAMIDLFWSSLKISF